MVKIAKQPTQNQPQHPTQSTTERHRHCALGRFRSGKTWRYLPTVPPCRNLDSSTCGKYMQIPPLKLTAIYIAPEDRPLFLCPKRGNNSHSKKSFFRWRVNLLLLCFFLWGGGRMRMHQEWCCLFYANTSFQETRYNPWSHDFHPSLEPPGIPQGPAESIRCHTETAPSKILGEQLGATTGIVFGWVANLPEKKYAPNPLINWDFFVASDRCLWLDGKTLYLSKTFIHKSTSTKTNDFEVKTQHL